MSIPMGLAEMGLIKDVHVSTGGHVEVTLRLTSPFCEMISFMKAEAIRRVGDLEGVAEVAVHHDSGLDWDHDLIAPRAQQRRRLRLDTLRRMVEEDAASAMVTTRHGGDPAREESRT
jgi:metal-sulfur cluster biosynthetic enzyme